MNTNFAPEFTSMTDEQLAVIAYRINKQGYECWGVTKSLLNGLDAVILNKGRHCMVVNSLGYDENRQGITWKVYKDFEFDCVNCNQQHCEACFMGKFNRG